MTERPTDERERPTTDGSTATGEDDTAHDPASATAHAPGSVTLAFAPVADSTGSRGISLATADGVTATVTPAAETAVTLDGTPTTFEPVAGVLDRLGVDAHVALEAATPVGAGFGASGAATLATALAADAAFGLDRDREALVEAAHRAEVAAGTGLGDVFVQDRGGMAYDVGDGRQRQRRTDELWYASHGGVATASVLDDEAALDRVREAAGETFAAFDPAAPLSATVAEAWQFARRTGLATEWVRETVDRVEAAGGVATMAMVGETVVAVDSPSDEDRSPHDDWPPDDFSRTQIADTGARVLERP